MVDEAFSRVIALDERKSYNEMRDWLKTSGLAENQQKALFWKVFDSQRLAACYVVAVTLIDAGADDPAVRMVEFLGSLMFSKGMRCDSALDHLRRQLPTDSRGLEALRLILEPVVAHTTLNLFNIGNFDGVLTVLRAWTWLSPGIAAAFGESEPHGGATVPLLEFPSPLLARSARRAVVAARTPPMPNCVRSPTSSPGVRPRPRGSAAADLISPASDIPTIRRSAIWMDSCSARPPSGDAPPS